MKMRIKVFRNRRREDAIGLKIFPLGEYSTRDHEEEIALEVLADAISKGKCTINFSKGILTINFLYDDTGGSLKFYVSGNYQMEKILKHPSVIEVKRRYSLPSSGDELEKGAMIIYLI